MKTFKQYFTESNGNPFKMSIIQNPLYHVGRSGKKFTPYDNMFFSFKAHRMGEFGTVKSMAFVNVQNPFSGTDDQISYVLSPLSEEEVLTIVKHISGHTTDKGTMEFLNGEGNENPLDYIERELSSSDNLSFETPLLRNAIWNAEFDAIVYQDYGGKDMLHNEAILIKSKDQIHPITKNNENI